jgi:Ser/Thr protein kinase RdoA (MazF antagonist)
VNGVVEAVVGTPVVFEELKHKPGRRLTSRASGPKGSAIVKLYRSDRAPTVAERISALSGGPPEVEVPEVLAVNAAERVVVLSELQGSPLREAALVSDEEVCRRAGAAIAAWHGAWRSRKPAVLREHTIELELSVLIDHAALASPEIRRGVAAGVPELNGSWLPETVVHRDLYEEQVLIGERVGLIDLDDAALGPPELDVGNLLAHLDLLELRSARALARAERALLDGYATLGVLDSRLVDRCRTLSRLRLACLHDEPRLLAPARASITARVLA